MKRTGLPVNANRGNRRYRCRRNDRVTNRSVRRERFLNIGKEQEREKKYGTKTREELIKVKYDIYL